MGPGACSLREGGPVGAIAGPILTSGPCQTSSRVVRHAHPALARLLHRRGDGVGDPRRAHVRWALAPSPGGRFSLRGSEPGARDARELRPSPVRLIVPGDPGRILGRRDRAPGVGSGESGRDRAEPGRGGPDGDEVASSVQDPAPDRVERPRVRRSHRRGDPHARGISSDGDDVAGRGRGALALHVPAQQLGSARQRRRSHDG
jgi:hypothetical protein